MLRSKPDFEIDVTRGDVILGFNCSFANSFDSTELDESANGINKHNYILLSKISKLMILQKMYFILMK